MRSNRGQFNYNENEVVSHLSHGYSAGEYARLKPNLSKPNHHEAVSKLCAQGDEACSEEKYDLAITYFNKAITKGPKNASAYIKRGDAHYALNNYAKAASDYANAIKLDPTPNVSVYEKHGDACCLCSMNVKAIESYNQAIRLKPNSAVYYHKRGDCYSYLRNYDDAVKDCTQSINLNPKGASAYLKRGHAYYAQKKYAEAVLDYTLAWALMAKRDPFRKQFKNLKNTWMPDASHNDQNLLIIKNEDLFLFSKKRIFSALKALPHTEKTDKDKKIFLLKQCLDPSTPLGGRFWKQEGTTYFDEPCEPGAGTLWEIQLHLAQVDPNFVPEKGPSAKIHFGLFQKKTLHHPRVPIEWYPQKGSAIHWHNKL